MKTTATHIPTTHVVLPDCDSVRSAYDFDNGLTVSVLWEAAPAARTSTFEVAVVDSDGLVACPAAGFKTADVRTGCTLRDLAKILAAVQAIQAIDAD